MGFALFEFLCKTIIKKPKHLKVIGASGSKKSNQRISTHQQHNSRRSRSPESPNTNTKRTVECTDTRREAPIPSSTHRPQHSLHNPHSHTHKKESPGVLRRRTHSLTLLWTDRGHARRSQIDCVRKCLPAIIQTTRESLCLHPTLSLISSRVIREADPSLRGTGADLWRHLAAF